jgi:hypothetical protein
MTIWIVEITVISMISIPATIGSTTGVVLIGITIATGTGITTGDIGRPVASNIFSLASTNFASTQSKGHPIRFDPS